VTTILIGVDNSGRSEDAIAFGQRIADAAGADMVIACAYPYTDVPSRAANAALRDNALDTAKTMASYLAADPERVWTVVTANPSPAHALQKIGDTQRAALIVVGSTHAGRAGRVLPGSTGERLLHGAPCSVAVVPNGYHKRASEPIRRIGVAYNGTDEAKAAVSAATGLARALRAELEVIGVVSPEAYTPALMAGPSVAALRTDVERDMQKSLDAIVAEIPSDVAARSVRLTGGAAETLTERSEHLDLLITGSRGYGPLHSVLVGGVSGRLMRAAQCPVIVVPRGVQTPLAGLFDETTKAMA
jgi:nucleotide-binding universal stress UspA family protein